MLPMPTLGKGAACPYVQSTQGGEQCFASGSDSVTISRENLMIRRITYFFCASGLLLLAAVMTPAQGAIVFFDTDTGVMEVDGLPATTLNGVPVQASVLSTATTTQMESWTPPTTPCGVTISEIPQARSRTIPPA